MTYALISNGRVHQIFAEDPMLGDALDVRDVSGVEGIAENWTVSSGGKFSAPTTPVASDVPPAVSSAQAKIQLLRSSFLVPVQEAVKAIGGEVEIWFSEARTWQRDNPHVKEIGAGLNLSSDEIDDLFRDAAKIDA